MGWSGYGIYDGDGTLTLQTFFLDKAKALKKVSGNDDVIVLENSEDIEAWEYDGTQKVSEGTLAKAYENFLPAASKIFNIKMLQKDFDFDKAMRRNVNFEEDQLIPLTMVADFFLRQDAKMPEGLKEAAIKATQLLIESNHTKDFDSSVKRRNALKKHLKLFEEFEPKVKFKDGAVVPVRARKKDQTVAEDVPVAPSTRIKRMKP